VRIDKGIEGIGDGDFGMRKSRKPELRECIELRSDVRKFIDLPRGCAIVVDQPEERLLLSAWMTIESPCEESLGPHHKAEVCVNAAPARRSVITSTAGGELVEPDGGGQISFCHQRAERTTDRVAWIKAFSAEGDIGFVCAEIIEAPPPRSVQRFEIEGISGILRWRIASSSSSRATVTSDQ